MDAEHTAAVIARLREHPQLNGASGRATVIDGPASGTQKLPYVVVYVYTPNEERTKLEGPTDQATVTVVTHSVAATIVGARIVRNNVRQQMLDHLLTVPGWKCKPIGHPVGMPADWDDSTGTRVMDAVDEWEYVAEPV